MPAPPPMGWYPDPYSRHERRYWDGAAWTDHVFSRGHQSQDAAVTSPSPSPQAPAGWYPDPYGRPERRFWDGQQWTKHVVALEPGAAPSSDSPATTAPAAGLPQHTAVPAVPAVVAGGGHAELFDHSVLVVSQKATLLGSSVEYAVRDEGGRKVAAIREQHRGVTASLGERVRGVGSDRRRYVLDVVDPDGRTLLRVTRPETTGKSSVLVDGPEGNPIGQIVQETYGIAGIAAEIGRLGVGTLAGILEGVGLDRPADQLNGVDRDLSTVDHVRFGLLADGRRVGCIKAQTSKAWEFRVEDASGAEVARITKTWAGWAKERFTKADNYVLVLHRALEEPVRSLVVAAALAVDVSLKQGEQTHRSGSTRTYK